MRLTPILRCALLVACTSALGRDSPEVTSPPAERSTAMRIQLTSPQQERIVVTLNDSDAARDFASLLPLKLTFKDYARTEKVSTLPRRLTTRGAPAGFDPSVGDFAYYAPWGNLAVYYRDFDYSDGLVPLGKIESGLELLARFEGEISVEVQKAK